MLLWRRTTAVAAVAAPPMPSGLAAVLLVLLCHGPRTALGQCVAGHPACPCVSSYDGFEVNNTGSDDNLIVTIDGTQHNYGRAYGLSACQPHDANTAPYCDGVGAPSWYESTVSNRRELLCSPEP